MGTNCSLLCVGRGATSASKGLDVSDVRALETCPGDQARKLPETRLLMPANCHRVPKPLPVALETHTWVRETHNNTNRN